MKSSHYEREDIAKFLRANKIATMPELKEVLGTQVDVTVFRKLKELGYLSSYSHRGRYYTLAGIPKFDDDGLWCWRGVWFSKHGTLVGTAKVLVQDSPAGYLTKQLQERLHVQVKDALLKLVRQGELSRQRVDRRYLYCCGRPEARKRQLLARRLQEQESSAVGQRLDVATSSAQVKAAVVLFISLLDEKQRRLYAGLESLKWGHGGDRKVAAALALDVGAIARGRRELLEQDVVVGRVRRPGGGRKPIQKKRRRSSSASEGC